MKKEVEICDYAPGCQHRAFVTCCMCDQWFCYDHSIQLELEVRRSSPEMLVQHSTTYICRNCAQDIRIAHSEIAEQNVYAADVLKIFVYKLRAEAALRKLSG